MTEPSLEAALSQAEALDGWAFFEHAADPEKGRAQQEAASARGQRVAAHLARLYATDAAFVEAMDFLLDSTLRRATFSASTGLDWEKAFAWGVFREGQNSYAMALLALIAHGRRQRPQPGRDN